MADNIWSITLAPSIRQWFGSNETPVRQLGVVIRSADGSKKGTDGDSFVSVTDHLYKPFEPAAVRYASMPGGLQEGINLIDASTVTLVLYDKDKKGGHKDFAHVVGDFNDWKLSNESNSQMNRDDAAGCWWITLTGLQPTREYAFQYYVGTRAGRFFVWLMLIAVRYSIRITINTFPLLPTPMRKSIPRVLSALPLYSKYKGILMNGRLKTSGYPIKII